MAAATPEQLTTLAGQIRPLEPTWSATRRVDSTFTNGSIREGATWLVSDGTGRVWLWRMSPSRVIRQLQSRLGILVDAKFGPQTMNHARVALGDPLTAPLTREFMERLLGWAFHDGNPVRLPVAVELPDPTATPVRQVTGDATAVRVIDLVTGAAKALSTSSPDAQTFVPAPSVTVPADAQRTAQDAANAGQGLPVGTPPTPAPEPTPAETARVATSGLRIEGPDMGGGVIQVTATPLGGSGADAPGNPTGSSVLLVGLPPSAILAPGFYRLTAEIPAPVFYRDGQVVTEVTAGEGGGVVTSRIERTTRITYTTVQTGQVRVLQQSDFAAADAGQRCRAHCQQGRTDYAAQDPGCSCTTEEAPPAPMAQGTSVRDNIRPIQAGILDLSPSTKGAAKVVGGVSAIGTLMWLGEKYLWGRG